LTTDAAHGYCRGREHVAQQDYLVDIEVRLEQVQVALISEKILPRPRAEVRVRYHQRAQGGITRFVARP
jgi:hypothetical protein